MPYRTPSRLLTCFLVCLSLLFTAPSMAKEPVDAKALETAKKLMDIIVTGPFIDNMSKSTWGPLEKKLRNANPNVTEIQMNDMKTVFLAIQKDNMTEVMADMPTIYARYFTASELEDLYQFQISPVGRKSLKVMPQIMAEMMPIIMKQVQTKVPLMMEAFKKIVAEKGLKL